MYKRVCVRLACAFAAAVSLSVSALSQTTSECSPMLIPQIEWKTLDTFRHVAYLKLIDKSAFESAQKDGSINVVLPELGLPIGASYKQFDEARTRYVERTRLQLDEAQSVAVFRQTLSPDQLKLFVDCMQTKAAGVRLLLSDDTAEGVTAKLVFSGVPGRSERFKLVAVGGQLPTRGDNVTLPHGGEQQFFVKRSSPASDLRIFANSVGMAASAFSFASLPFFCPPSKPCPNLEVGRIAPVSVTASPDPGGLSAVIDRDLKTGWNSGVHPPVTVDLQLPGPMVVTSIELTPNTSCTGNAHYQVLGFTTAGGQVTLGAFDLFVGRGQLYTYGATLDTTHRDIVKVQVVAVSVDSWVAYQEIALFGYQAR
jgi:hypothetical protein